MHVNILKKRIYTQEGFNLVELIIVISIIGILAGIAIPNYNEYKKRAYNDRAKSQAKDFHMAVLAYLSDADINALEFISTSENLNQLQGFIRDDEVTIGLSTWTISSNGTIAITGNPTFKHNKGDRTYILDSSGFSVSP